MRIISRTFRTLLTMLFWISGLTIFYYFYNWGTNSIHYYNEHSFIDFEPMVNLYHLLNLSKYEIEAEDYITTTDKSELKARIHKHNSNQYVLNEDNYGSISPSSPSYKPISVIILIQVHNRIENLLSLIYSLQRVHTIEDALLIFSSDFYSPQINKIVNSIRFTRVAQIFFPYSIQLYPDSFPGTDPRDCSIYSSSSDCPNKYWRDVASNYRNSSYTQIKHHWLWKILFVTEKFDATKDFSGYFILLEDDHFVLEDALHVLRLVDTLNHEADFFSLGSHEKNQDYAKSNEIFVKNWVSSMHNMGLAFKRSTLDRLKMCWQEFCTYDDYNWDWSLQFITTSCIKPRSESIWFKFAPRVHHLGICGFHSVKERCDVQANIINLITNLALTASPHLFPTKLSISSSNPRTFLLKKNGGWADLRDQTLCLSMASNRWLTVSQHPACQLNNTHFNGFTQLIAVAFLNQSVL